MNTHISVADYTKVLDTHCDDDAYGSYDTIDQAKSACDSDSNCKGVYDNSCDGETRISLCSFGSDSQKSTIGSCVYIKGMYTYA